MTRRLLVIGAGGFGREVVAIVEAINAVEPTWDLIGVLDDQPSTEALSSLQRLGTAHIGPIDRLPDLMDEASAAVLGIGSPAVRARLDQRFPDVSWATLVHPDATIGADVRLGPGTVVAPGARLSTAIAAGRHLHVDQNATVGHDTIIGDHVRLNPQACVSGAVTLADRCLIGAGAVVLQSVKVGADAVVGAGAVVVRDVVPGGRVKGVPAR